MGSTHVPNVNMSLETNISLETDRWIEAVPLTGGGFWRNGQEE